MATANEDLWTQSCGWKAACNPTTPDPAYKMEGKLAGKKTGHKADIPTAVQCRTGIQKEADKVNLKSCTAEGEAK
ncbi:Hypothetical predicted protein [Pelobates cultripes]|uniref:Uncharacterized protein n=1 Tax=Pelobates cultripes TaxID=61616 RepID=A0AAD1S647_PELCU|nr:Hypothetical predicted protein [Pelobates cultripes]